jgi:2,3-bisphosphoglycerate-independent phosphoglycerate mutase
VTPSRRTSPSPLYTPPMPSPNSSSSPRPLLLIIRDGWGANPNPSHEAFDAVHQASLRGLTPVADRLMRDYPWTLIKTSGEDVGLPDGTMGNSEVGHQNIGAGRIVPQESLVMTKACEAGLHTNVAIKAAIERCVGAKGVGSASGPTRNLHLMGISSDAGVHGLLEHLYAIVVAAKKLGLAPDQIFIHLFGDGRDSGPFTGKGYATQIQQRLSEIGAGRVVTIVGRYYAMDRDYRWERVKLAFDALTGRAFVSGNNLIPRYASLDEAIQNYYDHPTAQNLTGDEFITPRTVGTSDADVAASRIKPGDSVIFYNYRGDRPRELSAAFVFPDAEWAKVKASPDSGLAGFDRGTKLDLYYVTMTDYWEKLTPHVSAVAFPRPSRMTNISGEWLSTHGLRQFRDAETEKYPHVTFFFNDYRDAAFPGETRENPQSPKVATYDMKPEMSAEQVCAAAAARLHAPDCEDVLVINFANADMVGHTGKLDAAIAACAAVDRCVGTLVEATLKKGGALIVTADHGNAEQMFDPATGSPHTAHTTYDVPLIVVGEAFKGRTLRGDQNVANWFSPVARLQRGRLADIMPTLFAMGNIEKPAEMTGTSLIM